MKDLYKSIEECNPGKYKKVLIVLDDMISDVTSNKELHPVATKLLNRGQKRSIALVFIRKPYFLEPNNVRL